MAASGPVSRSVPRVVGGGGDRSATTDIVAGVRIFLAVITLGVAIQLVQGGSGLARAAVIALGAYLLFAILAFVARLVSWKAAALIRPVHAVIDEIAGLAAVIFFPATVLIYLPFVIFLLVTKRSQTSIRAIAIECLGFVAVIALHDRLAALWPAIPQAGREALTVQVTLLLFAAAASLALRAQQSENRATDQWNGELLETGLTARALPVEEICGRLRARFNAEAAIICLRQEEDRRSQCYGFDDAGLRQVKLDDEAAAQMLAPEGRSDCFLYETRTGLALTETRPALGLALRRIGTGFLPAELRGDAAIVGALPIGANSLAGYVYLLGLPRISDRLLGRLVGAVRTINATLDRYQMFEAWRERAFANARLDLSRDMHDSVLQTLAGLRMQVAVLLKDNAMPAVQRAERLQAVQSIIAAEQACLRELVNDSNQPIGEQIDLASHLMQRAELLSRQWGIACALSADPAELWVAPDVAVEVEFLVREAVSNAVQHARAARVEVLAAQRDDALFITIKSDGATVLGESGLPDVEGITSRSLAKRLKALNGRAYADPIERGVLLSLRIPLEAAKHVQTADS